jgi:predicted DNA-binding ribbon-helix-helix protein
MNRQDKQVGQTVASPIRKRSVKVPGRKSSVRALHEIARARGSTLSALVNSVHQQRKQGNLSSALRVFVLEHFRSVIAKQEQREG